MEARELRSRTASRSEGVEHFGHADIAGNAVVRRQDVFAVEPVAGAEIARDHHEARGNLDIEGAEQARVDPERAGLIAIAPDCGDALLEARAVALREIRATR